MFAKIELFLAKQSAWVALNPKKAVLYWAASLVGAFLVGKIL
jgi:hypothetical protein